MTRGLCVLLASALLHCGSTSTGGNDGSRIDDAAGGGSDAGSGDAAAGTPCPAAAPATGDACTRAGLVCQYGDDPRVDCRFTATCDGAHFGLSMACRPLPPVMCPATRAAAAGQPCTPMDAYCSYDGLACQCTNCDTAGPAPRCTMSPTWHCEAPNPNPQCPAARPNAGTACAPEGMVCNYGCGMSNGRTCQGGIWTIAGGGPCPVSTRRAKRDIEYVSDRDANALAAQVRATRLATYEYTDPALAGRRHLGFILEDQPGSFAVDPERSQVDLYGYTSLLVAAVQAQQRQIDALEHEVSALRASSRRR